MNEGSPDSSASPKLNLPQRARNERSSETVSLANSIDEYSGNDEHVYSTLEREHTSTVNANPSGNVHTVNGTTINNTNNNHSTNTNNNNNNNSNNRTSNSPVLDANTNQVDPPFEDIDINPPAYNSVNIDLPPAYSDVSGPPFCYGFVDQQRSLFTRYSHRAGSMDDTRGYHQENETNAYMASWYNGLRFYVAPEEFYNPRPGQTQRFNARNASSGRMTHQSPTRVLQPKIPTSSPMTCVLVLVFWLIAPTVAFLLGVVFIDSCPVESNIPVFMIIAGCVLMIRGVLFTVKGRNSVCISSCSTFLDIFTIFWIIIGSFWVFSVTDEVIYEFDPNGANPHYCQKTLYTFAIWFLAAFYLLFALAWIFAIVCICVYLTDTRSTTRVRHNRRNAVINTNRQFQRGVNRNTQRYHTTAHRNNNSTNRLLLNSFAPTTGIARH